ncbi:hypothetical protein NIT60_05080 [Mammaliicoccus sciuri]|nr:hypothetical protein NIT60_05080 [Mammaliicoccus sciuri]
MLPTPYYLKKEGNIYEQANVVVIKKHIILVVPVIKYKKIIAVVMKIKQHHQIIVVVQLMKFLVIQLRTIRISQIIK